MIPTLREWLIKFNNGDFNDTDFKSQCEAGWAELIANDKDLAGRLKVLGNILNLITNDYILDSYNIWFRSFCTLQDGNFFDGLMFEPITCSLSRKEFFGVYCDDKRVEGTYVVYTFNGEYEEIFFTNSLEELIVFIDKLGVDFGNQKLVVKPKVIEEHDEFKKYMGY